MSNFHVGQKVVCVKRDGWIGEKSREPYPGNGPRYGAVYTIARLDPVGDEMFLGLVEFGKHPTFLASNFRPITERKTSIEVFKKLLVPNKTAEPV